MFKVGDKVFDIRLGNGVVEKCENTTYPIFVDFGNGIINQFTREGKLYKSDNLPTLYKGHDLKVEIKQPEKYYVNLYWRNNNKEEIIAGSFSKTIEEANLYSKHDYFLKTIEVTK